MKELDDDFIKSGLLNSEDNTYSGRYSSAIPHFEKNGAVIRVQGNGSETLINTYDEITLYLLAKYLFLPLWLVEQWYEGNEDEIVGTEVQDGKGKVKNWVKLNLCWLESTPTGIYMRPTKALFTLFNMEMEKYSNIPTNTLTHTICEIGVAHDIMSGDHPLLKKFNHLPRQSMLGLPPQSTAANIVCESDFRNPGMWTKDGIEEVIRVENSINMDMEAGKIVTEEFRQFKYFSVIKKVDDTGIPNRDYISHIPDIVIPIVRDNGKPQSIAIETELTSKGVKGYEESIKRYKDNNKFGYVIYMCGGPGVAESLKKAYRKVGGSGETKFIIMEYKVPAPKFKF